MTSLLCVQVLHFSEHAAYLRIETARAARRFPAILDRLADGSLHLTAVSLLAPHLTSANHLEVLDAATHTSKRDVEELIARLRPKPDLPAVIRKLPTPQQVDTRSSVPIQEHLSNTRAVAESVVSAAPCRPAEIKPLAPERFKVQFTVSRETRQAEESAGTAATCHT